MADARRTVTTRGGRVAIARPVSGPLKWRVFNVNDMSTIKGLPGNSRSPKFARSDIVSGKRGVFRGMGTSFNTELRLIGWRTLIMDGYAGAVLMRSLAVQVTQISGELVRNSAIADAPFQDRTGDTRRSMINDPTMTLGDNFVLAEMGPNTFYSPFLEFGWMRGGNFNIYPFMIPASYKHQDDFLRAHYDVMAIVAGHRPRRISDPVGKDHKAAGTVSRARKWLYTTEKALGDVMVISGSALIGPMRSAMLTMAKELGDLQAIMNHAVGQRIQTRITGSVTGRALGYTRTVSVSKNYSGYPGGGSGPSVGSRAYNRFAGRATRPIATRGLGF